MNRPALILLAVLLAAAPAAAQDPTVVDPDHYTLEFENDYVRVLRVSYGAHEVSVMHEHPDHVAVILTDDQVWRMTNEAGESEDIEVAKGDALWTPAVFHLPANPTEARQEVVVVELKIHHPEKKHMEEH